MPNWVSIKTLALIASVIFFVTAAAQKTPSSPTAHQQKMQLSSLLFMENRGQVVDDHSNLKPDILFTANSGGTKLYLTANSIHYQFTKIEYPEGYDPFSKEPVIDAEKEEALRKQIKTITHRLTVELQGANSNPTISKQQQSTYFENYYLSQCPNGITAVHGYEKIIYKNVYPNIDWIVYSKAGFMEYDFLVHPGGNPAHIKIKIKDAESVGITASGELLMKTSLGEVREKAPVSYVDGSIVSSCFRQNSDGTIGFDVQPYAGKELRIDPSVVWATYYGGSGDEADFSSCATDVFGNAYLTGYTGSNTGIASGGFQINFGGGNNDAFLVKFDSSGNRIWATYYGGNSSDHGSSCAVDGNGNVYMAGSTSSTNAIASGGFQNTIGGGGDAFLVKFTNNGVRIWGTYYGGNDGEGETTCCLDGSNNIYLAGTTSSFSGIASGGFQNTNATLGNITYEAFLVKFNANGNRLWATYYGGERWEHARSCATDANGNVYLAGDTNSETGIAFNGFQNTITNTPTTIAPDAFLVKFDGSGNRLWATYYGNTSGDNAYACATDIQGNVYLAGLTQSTSSIAFNGFQNTYSGVIDGFLVKFNSNGNRLWGTYIGGSNGELVTGCCVDGSGDIFITGYTQSTNNIASCGFQNAYQGGQDIFLMKISSTGNRIWGTYYGGNAIDIPSACVADNFGNVFISGHTNSTSGIATGGFQNTLGGAFDAFLVKIGPSCVAPSIPVIAAVPDTICSGSATTLTITSGNLNNALQWYWYKDSCGGTAIDTGIVITVSPTATTTYYVRGEGCCVVPGNCGAITVTVKPASAITITATPTSICAGDTVTVTATTPYPNSPYNWNWGGGNVISGSNAGPYKVVYNSTGIITLSVSNGSCAAIAAPQTITVQPATPVSFAVNDSTGCDTLTVSFTNTSPPGFGVGYRWDFGDGSSSVNLSPPPHLYTNGTYKVTLTDIAGQCSKTFTQTVRVTASPVAAFSALPGINTPVQLSGANFRFTNTSQNATRYIWDFGDAQSSTLFSPTHSYQLPGNYAVRLFAYNNTDCADTFEVKPLVVVADSAIQIPNAFSPNKDGINDTWIINGLRDATNSTITIFNRWGQRIFHSKGYSKPWDGNYNGKLLPIDTYYYVITVGRRSYTGSVILIR